MTLASDLLDEILTRLDSLGPLGPASIVESLLLTGISGLNKGSINDCGCHTSATAANDGLGWVDTFGLEKSLEV